MLTVYVSYYVVSLVLFGILSVHAVHGICLPTLCVVITARPVLYPYVCLVLASMLCCLSIIT
jgi:hypothetical protein